MKDVKSRKKKFIEKCNTKLKQSAKSYSQISAATGISTSCVIDFFKGKSNAKIETIIKILNFLNCELKV